MILRVAGIAHDVDHRRIGLRPLDVRMQEERAEARRERLVPRDVEVLVAEEDHAVREERGRIAANGRSARSCARSTPSTSAPSAP
jgi:hypothetical protein